MWSFSLDPIQLWVYVEIFASFPQQSVSTLQMFDQ